MFTTNTKSPLQGLLGITPWGSRRGLFFLYLTYARMLMYSYFDLIRFATSSAWWP